MPYKSGISYTKNHKLYKKIIEESDDHFEKKIVTMDKNDKDLIKKNKYDERVLNNRYLTQAEMEEETKKRMIGVELKKEVPMDLADILELPLKQLDIFDTILFRLEEQLKKCQSQGEKFGQDFSFKQDNYAYDLNLTKMARLYLQTIKSLLDDLESKHLFENFSQNIKISKSLSNKVNNYSNASNFGIQPDLFDKLFPDTFKSETNLCEDENFKLVDFIAESPVELMEMSSSTWTWKPNMHVAVYENFVCLSEILSESVVLDHKQEKVLKGESINYSLIKEPYPYELSEFRIMEEEDSEKFNVKTDIILRWFVETLPLNQKNKPYQMTIGLFGLRFPNMADRIKFMDDVSVPIGRDVIGLLELSFVKDTILLRPFII